MIGGGNDVEAATVTSTATYNGTFYYQGTNTNSNGAWRSGLANPTVSASYWAGIYKWTPWGEVVVNPGASVSVGDWIRFGAGYGSVSYTGTGYTADTPTGAWVWDAGWQTGSPGTYNFRGITVRKGTCNSGYVGILENYYNTVNEWYSVYIPLSVHPAGAYLGSWAGSTLGLYNRGDGWFQVRSPGVLRSRFDFPGTYAKFYYEYDASGMGYPCSRSYDQIPMQKGHIQQIYLPSYGYNVNTQVMDGVYHMNLPGKNIQYDISASCPSGQIWNGASCINQTWTTYCTGDDRNNPWQWWQHDNGNPRSYRFVRAGDGTCTPNPRGDAGLNCSYLWAWACDSSNYNSALDVHIWEHRWSGDWATSQFRGSFRADDYVANDWLATQCGGHKDRGGSWTIPASLKDNANHTLSVYGINVGSGRNVLLKNLNLRCAPPATNGVCGSAHNSDLGSPPTSNLCSVGTPSASGQWSWSCIGSGVGHTNASCSAFALPKGDIGANCTNLSTWSCDADNYAQALDVRLYQGYNGDYSRPLGSIRADQYWGNASWNAGIPCGGYTDHGGSMITPDSLKTGTNQQVSAYGINIGTGYNRFLGTKTLNCPAKTNGACGSSNNTGLQDPPMTNLCSAGTPSASGQWSWTCNGTNGGSNASCSAQAIPKGGFGANCTGLYTWSCDASNYTQALDVRFYQGYNGDYSRPLGSIRADQYWGNASWNAGIPCGGYTDHGGSMVTPDSLKTGTNQQVTAYGINIGTGYNRALGTQTLNCPAKVNGTCGTSNGTANPFWSNLSGGACGTGTLNGPTLTGDTWSWTCGGENGGTTASCSATRTDSLHIKLDQGGGCSTATDPGSSLIMRKNAQYTLVSCDQRNSDVDNVTWTNSDSSCLLLETASPSQVERDIQSQGAVCSSNIAITKAGYASDTLSVSIANTGGGGGDIPEEQEKGKWKEVTP